MEFLCRICCVPGSPARRNSDVTRLIILYTSSCSFSTHAGRLLKPKVKSDKSKLYILSPLYRAVAATANIINEGVLRVQKRDEMGIENTFHG